MLEKYSPALGPEEPEEEEEEDEEKGQRKTTVTAKKGMTMRPEWWLLSVGRSSLIGVVNAVIVVEADEQQDGESEHGEDGDEAHASHRCVPPESENGGRQDWGRITA